MSTPQLFQVGPGDVALTSDDWYTPRWLFEAAGLLFDLDVCAPVDPAFRTCPAREFLTVVEDGLTAPWHGLVWCNPPYSKASPWVDRLAGHPTWLSLVLALHNKLWLGRVLGVSDAMALISPDFQRADGSLSTPFSCLVIAGRGPEAAGAVARIAAADKYAAGAYHVRADLWQ